MALPIAKLAAFEQVEKDIAFFKECLTNARNTFPANPRSVSHCERRLQALTVQRNTLILEATLTAVPAQGELTAAA